MTDVRGEILAGVNEMITSTLEDIRELAFAAGPMAREDERAANEAFTRLMRLARFRRAFINRLDVSDQSSVLVEVIEAISGPKPG